MRKIYFFFLALFAAAVIYFVLVLGGEDRSLKINGHSMSQRERLFREMFLHGVIFVYPASDSADSKLFTDALQDFRTNFRRIKIKILPDTSATPDDLKNNSIILAGTYKSNTVLKKISARLPVKFSEKEFSFKNDVYKDSASLITMLRPNPWNNRRALYLISGNSNKYIVENMNLRMTDGIRIFDNGLCDVMDSFNKNYYGSWVPDTSGYLNFAGMRKIFPDYGYYKYTVYSDNTGRTDLKKVDRVFSEGIEKMKRFFGDDLRLPKTNCYIFNNLEEKGLITGNTHLENIDWKDSSIRLVYNDWIKGDDFYSNALLILRHKLGKPATDFLEKGLAMHFSEKWRKEGYDFWAAFIARSGNTPPLQELLNNNALGYISPYIAEPLSGTFADFLINKLGRKYFLEHYKNWTVSDEEIKSLESEWHGYLKNLVLKNETGIEKYKSGFVKRIPAFQKGFCFAHVGYDIYNGYISGEAKISLGKIKELGANSFSITPFTSMRDASKPEPLRFWEFAGAENDESLIYLSHIASELKMTVMMKPQIYLGRNHWPGDIKMNSGKDWKLFFHYYFDWISHYAMLSEMYGIPLLCLGNELEAATVGHEKQWVNLITKIRKLYDGKITYGANWNYEFKEIKFWNYLDYMGISEYYPLSSENNPTDSELLTGAESVMKKINEIRIKYNKPVIFTEVGFRSTQMPWKTALENQSSDKVNLESQKRCYNALFKASFGKTWLAGMYWWKWPSYLSYGGSAENKMFVPNNKPAESVVKKWYSKKWN